MPSARLGLAPVLLVLLASSAGLAGPAERLAEALRFPTISQRDADSIDAPAFRGFHAFLQRSYPRVHASLRRHLINDWSLLYVWEGREPELQPVLWTSHFDVVPVPGRSRWRHDPFAGVIEGGYVWGRGALDDKAGVIAMLEAVERRLGEGFRPRRTHYLAFGHDEEVGGRGGAGATAAWLAERDVRLLFSLDEGMAILDGAMPGVEGPVAVIGIAEKGYLSLDLVARAAGGHSSTPPPSSAIGILARAITRLESKPLPARMGGVVDGLLDGLAPELPFFQRLMLRNRWLTSGLIARRFSRSPATNAMIRTTTAVTMVSGGVKENVLPGEARATVNFRISPGDSSESVLAHVRRVLEGTGVEIEVGRITEPSPVADVDSASYAALVTALAEVVPGVPVVPGLVLGGTDSKHYAPIADDSYRFTAYRLTSEDRVRFHGVDERIAIDNLEGTLIDFYATLLRTSETLSGDGP